MPRRVAAATAALVVAAGLAFAQIADASARAAESPTLEQIRDGGGLAVISSVREGTGEVETRTVGSSNLDGGSVSQRARFRGGSLTKPLVATAVLQQVDRGAIALDDPIERYLPDELPYGESITVRQLLQHTSGLPSGGLTQALMPDPPPMSREGWFAWMTRDYSAADYLAAAAEVTPRNTPGEKFEYANINFTLAALVLESVTGEPFAETVYGNIFRPLRMTRSSFPEGSKMRPPLLSGYMAPESLGEPADASVIDVTKQTSWIAYGSGDVITTTVDLTTFFDALADGRLISKEALTEMTTPTPQSGSAYGLGLQVEATSCGIAVGHGGNYYGYDASAFTVDGRTVATAASADGSWQRADTSGLTPEYLAHVTRIGSNVFSQLCPGQVTAQTQDAPVVVDQPIESLLRR